MNAECTHKGVDAATCHCKCEVCGLENCICCVLCDKPEWECQCAETTADDDPFWRRVDRAMSEVKERI